MANNCEACGGTLSWRNSFVIKGSDVCRDCLEKLESGKEISGFVPKKIANKQFNSSSQTQSYQYSSISIGVILFVVGLIAFIMRGELTVKIVGGRKAVRDAFFGGGSTGDTLTVITIISGIAMIIGLILLIKGIIKASTINK